MNKRFKKPFGLISGSIVALLCALAAQGTGQAQFSDIFHSEQTMVLVRKLPPMINVKGASFRIEASKTEGVRADVVDTLVTKTRGLLLKDRDAGLRLDDSNPNYTLRCKVTGYEVEITNFNEGSGTSERKYAQIIGTIEATIEVLDSAKTALDSDNLKSHFERTYLLGGAGVGSVNMFGGNRSTSKGRAPTPLEQRDLVVEGLAAQVAQRLVSVQEDVDVKLPFPGQFKDMQEMARHKQWGQLQEAAEKMPPPKKDEDDSYRLYMLGLGYEGLAYDKAKEQPDEAKELLTKAFQAYSDAKAKKSKEQYFIQPQIRTQESLDSYLAIERFKKMASVAKVNPPASEGPKTPGTPPPAPPNPTADEWNNQTLVTLKKNGMSDDVLITMIRNAKDPKFDADTPKGAIELANGGISSAVMQAIAAKMHPTPAPTPSRPAQTPAKKP